jgi:hypothetical protein
MQILQADHARFSFFLYVGEENLINYQDKLNIGKIVHFNNGEIRLFDVKPYQNFPSFQELKDKELFKTVRPALGVSSLEKWSGFLSGHIV